MQLFTAKQYLQIDIASNFGLSKSAWDDRISWTEQRESTLETLVKDAEEPALYAASVQAYRAAQQGKPSGYPISLDATASGLQLLAVLAGDRKAASLCNVIDTGNREDAYTNVYEEMLKHTGDYSKISHDDVKNAVMTSLYGSEAVPKEVFGEGALLELFHRTMENLAPGAWELNKAFLAMWDSKALEHSWTLPDGFVVKAKVMDTERLTVHIHDRPHEVYYKVNRPMAYGKSLAANGTHSVDGLIVREVTRRCNYEPSMPDQIRRIMDMPNGIPDKSEDTFMVRKLWELFKYSGYLSARILDHITASNKALVDKAEIIELLDSLPPKPFEVMSIHDCFRVLPNYGNEIRKQYNLQLSLIARSNMLSFMVSQILNRAVPVNKLTSTLADEALEANYALS